MVWVKYFLRGGIILVGLEKVNGDGVEVVALVEDILGVVEDSEKVEGFRRIPTRKCGRVVCRI